MSLFWKVTVVFSVLAAVNAGIPHKTHKMGIVQVLGEMPDTQRNTTRVDSDGVDIFHETLVQGFIKCNGVPQSGVRPFLQSPWFKDEIAVITTSLDDGTGYYELFTTEVFKGHKSMLLTIRHQCPQRNFVPMRHCAIPIYWTEFSFPLDPSRLSFYLDIDLGKVDDYTRSDCLH